MPEWGVYTLILFAAAAHAGWNVILKGSDDHLLSLAGLRAVGLPIAVCILAVVPNPSASAIPYLIGNVCFMYAYYFFLLNAYRIGELSSVYQIARGLAPIAVLSMTFIFVVDRVSHTDVLATVVVSIGIFLLAKQKNFDARQLLFAIATGLCIAGYSMLAGIGVRHSQSVLGYLAWSEILTAVGLIPIALMLRRNELHRYFSLRYKRIVVAGMLALAGFGITLWAFNQLPLGPVTAVRESSIGFAMLFGVIFLRESFSSSKAIALCLILGGVVTLAVQAPT